MAIVIDIPGTFLNTKDGHLHTVISALCETIDNAHDAKAKNIKICVTKDYLTVSDDGCGMDPKKLGKSHILNKRSVPGSKHGRYGEGLKAFILHFFNEGADPAITISSAGGEPHDVKFNFNSITGPELSTPGEVGRTNQVLWDKYKLSDIGTVIRVPINEAMFEKITNYFNSTSIFENLRFQFGQIYYASDINIILDVNGGLYTTPKISPIADPTQVFIREYPEDNVNITSCWVEDASVQDPFLNSLGITYNATPGRQNQKKIKNLGGKFITRGGRVISRQDINKPGAGDRWKQDIAFHTRHVVNFAPSIETDSLFGVSVNKSNLDQSKMDKSIKRLISGHIKAAQSYFEAIRVSRWELEPVVEVEPEPVVEVEPEPESEPTITFDMLTRNTDIIIKYGEQILYSVPCPKPSRAAYQKIFQDASKNANFNEFVEGIIEVNKILMR